MQILFNFLVAILATTIGGISGVGGGVIIKPVMDAVSGLPVATISFLSGCTVLAMTITSMVRSWSPGGARCWPSAPPWAALWASSCLTW